MARRSLRPHLNQIRSWVRQGRTDAWIAHQLEVSVQQIQAFKKDNDLLPEGEGDGAPGVDFDDEIDLRAEDDALIAAELEAAEAARREQEAAEAAAAEAAAAASLEAGEAEAADEAAGAEARPAARRRTRSTTSRTRRPKAKAAGPLEGTFDHGEEGYGLWLDPAVADNPVYAEHWAGHRPVEITIEEDQIVIRRAAVAAEARDDA
jgi:hypothetical protein